MIAREYIDEVKLRLNRLGISSIMNDALILNYINKARRDVQIATMAILPERYGRRDVISLNNTSAEIDDDTMVHLYYPTYPIEVRRFQLPADYLEIMSLWIVHQEDNAPVYREARRINKQELHNVKTHCFNMPTIDRPIYALEGKQADYFGSQDNICYIAGLRNQGQNIFDVGNVLIEIWAIVTLTDFDLWNEPEDRLSIDLQEFAVQQAMLYCLNGIEHIKLKASLQQQAEAYKQMVIQNYAMFKDQPIHTLPSHEGL